MKNRHLLALVLFSSLLLTSLHGRRVLAHEGEQHAAPDIKAVALPTEGMRAVYATTENYEVVVKVPPLMPEKKEKVLVYISDFATNAPVGDLEVNVTLPGTIDAAIPVEPTQTLGVYGFDLSIPKVGTYELLFDLQGERPDLVPVSGLQVEKSSFWKKIHLPKIPWKTLIFVFLAVIAGFFGRKRIRKIISAGKNLASKNLHLFFILLLLSAPASVLAHGGESHGDEEPTSTTEAAVRDKTFLPKESQFLLGLHTVRLEKKDVQKRVQAIGKIVPRPQTSAEVFSMQEGIIFPSSDTNFVLPGKKIRKGEVLAVIQSIGSFEVRAPISGTVTEVLFTRGQHVEHDTKLLSIIDFSRLWVEANVYEADLPKLKKGRTALIQSESFPGKSFEGTLINLGQVINPATQAAKAIFEVRNREELLRVGMFVQVDLDTGEKAQEILIPESAIVERGDKKFVFIHTLPEEFISREITLGEKIEGNWVVRKGLQEGERVVTQGNYQLSSMGEKKP